MEDGMLEDFVVSCLENLVLWLYSRCYINLVSKTHENHTQPHILVILDMAPLRLPSQPQSTSSNTS